MRRAAILATTTIAVIGLASVVSAQRKPQPNPNIIPRGAVIAFNLAKACPRGWHDYTVAAGRAIIGMGAGAGLTPRALGDLGGNEKHVLTVAEMPTHTHGGNVSLGGHSYEHHQYGNGRMPGQQWQSGTQASGGGQPHPTMPPFVALRYCEKE